MIDPWYYDVPPTPHKHRRYERPLDFPLLSEHYDLYQERQDYGSYEFQGPISYIYAADPTKEWSNNASKHLYPASRPGQPEYYISVDIEDQDYQVHPSSRLDDYLVDYHNRRPRHDGAPSYPSTPLQNYQKFPPTTYQNDPISPVSMFEKDQSPFIPPPLHLEPAMYWTIAPSQTKEEEEYRIRLESWTPADMSLAIHLPLLSGLDASDHLKHHIEPTQPEQSEIEEAGNKQVEDEFERDGFEVTGSVISQREGVRSHTGLMEEFMEDRIEALKEDIENQHGLMEEVIDKGRHYSSERKSVISAQNRKKRPNPIAVNNEIRRLPLIEKEQPISSPTIAINPNKFWESLMKKNQSPQQKQQPQNKETTLTHVMPTPTKGLRADSEQVMHIEHHIEGNDDKDHSKKRKGLSGRPVRQKLVDSSKRKESSRESEQSTTRDYSISRCSYMVSGPPVKKRKTRQPSSTRPVKKESRSDRYKRLRGELVVGQGMDVTSESSSDEGECEPVQQLITGRDKKPRGRPPKLNIGTIERTSPSQDELLIESPARDDTPSPRLSPTTEKAFKLATTYGLSNERKGSLLISLTDLLGITQSDEDAWKNEELHDTSMESYESVEI
jgi:hypothetical protein